MSSSQTNRIARDRQLMAGIAKHLGKGDQLIARGKKYKPSEVLAMLQERIDVTEPVAPAKAAWMACVKEQEQVLASTDPVVADIIAYLRLAHDGDVKLLADFGLAPRTRRELSPEQKVARADKARKTRELRHTMGKRQKEQLPAPDATTLNGATQPK